MTDKMIVRLPAYCESFRCSASECSDNCCIGWEIDIDGDTASYYKSIGGDYGERLKKNIDFGDCSSFILKGERCPFLNENNLCDIIIALGENRLCQICSDHPRYFEWYGKLKEGGIGLCCEEAARLILTCENPLEFTEKEADFEQGDEFDEELFDYLFKAREKIFSVIYNEKAQIKSIVGSLLGFAERLQYNIDNGIYILPDAEDVTEKKGDMVSVLNSLTVLESIDENWEPYLEFLIEAYGERAEQSDFSFYQKNLLIYFIYRYFLKGVFDGEILSKVKLAAVSTAIITYIIEKEKELKGNITLKDAVDVCKLYSKQVEYSQENLDLLTDLFYEKEFFSSEKIKGLY